MSNFFKECGSVDFSKIPDVDTPKIENNSNYPTLEDQEFDLLQKRLELQLNVKNESETILDNNSK